MQYPATWTTLSEPANGDGASFTTPSQVKVYSNGSGSGIPSSYIALTAAGTVNSQYYGDTFSQIVHQIEDQYIPNLKKQSGIFSVNYGVVSNKWIWITFEQTVGTAAIHTQESYITTQSDQTLTLLYPDSQTNRYQPIWNHITSTFDVGHKAG